MSECIARFKVTFTIGRMEFERDTFTIQLAGEENTYTSHVNAQSFDYDESAALVDTIGRWFEMPAYLSHIQKIENVDWFIAKWAD